MKKKIILSIMCIFCTMSSSCSAKNVASTDIQNKITLGIDKLIQDNFALIKGKKIGLFTNFSGRTQAGLLTAEILANSAEVNLIKIYSPEHGFYGGSFAGEAVDNSEFLNIKMISLYGSARRPNVSELQELDLMLIDIQDIGIRSYTFLSSVNYMLAGCADAGIEVLILDRPNPMGGNIIDGSVTESGSENFMSLIPISYVHGLTIGEVAVMMNEEGWIKNATGNTVKCSLSVITMNGWERAMRWDDCGLLWFPTSPQIPSPDAIFGAATLGIWGELSLFNIGIGTSLPFRYLGMPDFAADKVFNEINKFNNEGVLIQIAHFKPFYGKFSQQYCKGFIFNYPKVNDNCKPYSTGVNVVLAIRKIYPDLFNLENISKDKQETFKKVTGGSQLLEAIFSNKSDKEVIEIANKGVTNFNKLRDKYLIYE